jgi:N-acetylglucosaminyldiphosphoundecaprenol N-acetyl-beta-D-mannosaminyltransferase
MKILNIPIEVLSWKEILARAEAFLREPSFHQIVTINPEFLLLAGKDESFRKVLMDADMRVVDGFGIVLVGWLSGQCISRFPGADLMEEILCIANRNKLSVYLVVRADGLSKYEEVKEVICKKYPNIEVTGTNVAVPSYHSSSIIHTASIVFCNFGAPMQELFLADLKNHPENIRLAMGVGGAFDYLTGKQKRAPKWLRFIGLEWLWRLIEQPYRYPRIWNATVIFLYKVLKENIYSCKKHEKKP